jgi:hypothetical protein
VTLGGIHDHDDKLEFESSEDIELNPTFDSMGLREDLLRGIYAFSMSINFVAVDYLHLREEIYYDAEYVINMFA